MELWNDAALLLDRAHHTPFSQTQDHKYTTSQRPADSLKLTLVVERWPQFYEIQRHEA